MSATRDIVDLSAETFEAVVGHPLRILETVWCSIIMLGGGISTAGVAGFVLVAAIGAVSAPLGAALAIALGTTLLGALLGSFVAAGVAVSEWPEARVDENLFEVALRFPALGLYYLAPSAALAFAAWRYATTLIGYGAEEAPMPDPAVTWSPLAACLLVSSVTGLAPVAIMRGAGLRQALALSVRAMRGRLLLGFVLTLAPSLLLGGGIVSYVTVLQLRGASSTHFAASQLSESATLCFMIASLIVTPFFAGILKHAAFRIATGETELA